MRMMPFTFSSFARSTISLAFPISFCQRSKVGATTAHGLVSVSWCLRSTLTLHDLLYTEDPTAAAARAHASCQVYMFRCSSKPYLMKGETPTNTHLQANSQYTQP
ncbi:hypothetical protein EDD16DRAFT_1635501 [Pisolithus croceorrhizus]|nr:hypothetical protein EDD16DRAFT_1635501 [Pisolithus croceorrhizus]KAI6113297.1 hypothetical protein EV401DRAFT_193431 [Pisolithus croceorrhizus]